MVNRQPSFAVASTSRTPTASDAKVAEETEVAEETKHVVVDVDAEEAVASSEPASRSADGETASPAREVEEPAMISKTSDVRPAAAATEEEQAAIEESKEETVVDDANDAPASEEHGEVVEQLEEEAAGRLEQLAEEEAGAAEEKRGELPSEADDVGESEEDVALTGTTEPAMPVTKEEFGDAFVEETKFKELRRADFETKERSGKKAAQKTAQKMSPTTEPIAEPPEKRMLLLDCVRSMWVPSSTTRVAALCLGAGAATLTEGPRSVLLGAMAALVALSAIRQSEIERIEDAEVRRDVRATSFAFYAVVAVAGATGALFVGLLAQPARLLAAALFEARGAVPVVVGDGDPPFLLDDDADPLPPLLGGDDGADDDAADDDGADDDGAASEF